MTALDTNPGDWVNLGEQTLSDGTVIHYSFDQLWEIYENPPQEESTDVIKEVRVNNILHNH